MADLYITVCASCATKVIKPDSINMDMSGYRSRCPLELPWELGLLWTLLNPRMSLYTLMILYTMRPVTSAFTANERKKNAVTAEKYQSGLSNLSATNLMLKPRVVNAVTMKKGWGIKS